MERTFSARPIGDELDHIGTAIRIAQATVDAMQEPNAAVLDNLAAGYASAGKSPADSEETQRATHRERGRAGAGHRAGARPSRSRPWAPGSSDVRRARSAASSASHSARRSLQTRTWKDLATWRKGRPRSVPS